MTASHHARTHDLRLPADHDIDELRRLIAAAFEAPEVVLDEDYRLTAFVAQRPSGGPADTVVIELIDRGPRVAVGRWQAVAYIERPEPFESAVSNPLVCGETAAAVIRLVADHITANGSSAASLS